MKPEDYLIRELPDQKPRVETGPVKFGGDWPGLFIRGDNAFHYAVCLKHLLENAPKSSGVQDIAEWAALRGLLAELESCKITS